jgi:hypothetical protein
MPVPPASEVNRLPAMGTLSARDARVEHVTEDESLWTPLWRINRAVSEAYGLNAADVTHILMAFPVLYRKRRNFMAFLFSKVNEWSNE